MLMQPSEPIELERLFETGDSPLLQLAAGTRLHGHINGADLLEDRFKDARCVFARCASDENRPISIEVRGSYRVEACAAGGWLVRPASDALPSFWVPRLPLRRKPDDQGHILSEAHADIDGIDANANFLAIRIAPSEGSLDFVIWRLDDPELAGELSSLSVLERQAWYLWGSHTTYRRPADVYLHLIHGHVYENRVCWPFYWKICSENDAHALYVTLTGLMRATGKRIYALLRVQLALSVVSRLGEDGAFRHGEWSRDMESHYRLHASGMHLMMDYLAEHDDPNVAAGLARAAEFLATRPDHTDLGAWFLHDDLELSPKAMQKSPFSWKPSNVLGKCASNMLVLNTHLDTLIGLERSRDFLADGVDADLLKSAAQAAGKSLQLRPAETLYKIISSILYLTFLPSDKAAALPLYKRALKRIGWKWLAPRFHHLKTAQPRLVMPGGYIDRALSIKGVSDAYQSINLMDILRYLRRFPDETAGKVIREALAFTRTSGILDRWGETPEKKYALGFWVEALWHACALYPDIDYRAWLAEAMLVLESKDMGQPPSLLGANAEAISPAEQHACPSPSDSKLRVVNLSRGKKQEILIINGTDAEIRPAWTNPPDPALLWQDSGGRKLNAEVTIPAHGWVRGWMG